MNKDLENFGIVGLEYFLRIDDEDLEGHYAAKRTSNMHVAANRYVDVFFRAAGLPDAVCEEEDEWKLTVSRPGFGSWARGYGCSAACRLEVYALELEGLSLSINLPIKMYSCRSTMMVGWFLKKSMIVRKARRASSCDGGFGDDCPLNGGLGGGFMDKELGERIDGIWCDCCEKWLTAKSIPKGDSPISSRGYSRTGAIKECEY